jgi:lysophospholipase L1-like esterase
VRRAAAGDRAVLVDAERALAGGNPAELFRGDQIHLRPAGHQALATLLAGAITKRVGE